MGSDWGRCGRHSPPDCPHVLTCLPPWLAPPWQGPPPPRMYLVGPHSERDPQLVCRLCLAPPHRSAMHPSLDTLDARGCFLIHLETCLVIWVGKECRGMWRSAQGAWGCRGAPRPHRHTPGTDVPRKAEEARAGAERLQLYERAPTLVYTLVQPGTPKDVTAELPDHTESDLSSPGYQKLIESLSSPTSDRDQWLSVSRAQPLEEVFAIEASGRGSDGSPQLANGGGGGGDGDGHNESPKPELFEVGGAVLPARARGGAALTRAPWPRSTGLGTGTAWGSSRRTT